MSSRSLDETGRLLISTVTAAALLGLLLVDTLLPAGASVGALYVALVATVGKSLSRVAAVVTALVSMVFILAGWWLPAATAPSMSEGPVRLMAIAAVAWVGVVTHRSLAGSEPDAAAQGAAIGGSRGLDGLLPICAQCHKIRNAVGQWQPFEQYIREHSRAEFTHGLCGACVEAFDMGSDEIEHERSRLA